VPGKIDVTGFTYGITSPRDAATGQLTGRRQHKPVHVVKPISAASPQFFQALVNNEVLSSVVIDFVTTNPALKEGGRLNYSVRLTGARVSNVEQFTETEAGVTRLMEAIDITFQTIELTHAPSQTVATDTVTPTS
jgi:type VI secretion system secreted protein Hcp